MSSCNKEMRAPSCNLPLSYLIRGLNFPLGKWPFLCRNRGHQQDARGGMESAVNREEKSSTLFPVKCGYLCLIR